MQLRKPGTLVLWILLLCPLASYGSSYYLVTTNQATANTQLDINHTRTWSFTPTQDFDLGGGSFKIKEGPSTTEAAVLSLYMLPTVNAPVTTVSVAAAVVTQSYDYVAFLFATPVTLTAGNSYYLALTSLTGDKGSEQYFIKGGAAPEDFAFYDSYPEPGDPAPAPTSDGPATPTFDSVITTVATPEPGTSAMMMMSVLGLVGLARRQRRRMGQQHG